MLLRNGRTKTIALFLTTITLTVAMPLRLARTDDAQTKYALVIGGASKQAEPEYQEFARNTAAVTEGLTAKGYRVATLFGGPVVQGSEALVERSRYFVDYSKIGALQIAQKPQIFASDPNVTAGSIDAALAALVAKAKPGDQIQIYVTAHGEDSCGELGTLIRNDLGSGCHHTFTVFNAEGHEVQYPSDKIIDALSKLEAKGALPTLVLDSCHSGRAMNEFKAKNLAKTCAYFETAGNETGYGCFENDPAFAKDYTSTGEYISMRYYAGILDRLQKDPYFSNNHGSCFGKTIKHFQEKKMDLSTIESAYWSSRLYDASFESPSISSLISLSYFTKGEFSPYLPESKPLSCTQVNLELDSFVRELSDVKTLTVSIQKSAYDQSIEDYNSELEKLSAALDAIKTVKSPSQDAVKNVAGLQAQVETKANLVVERERALIQTYYQQSADSAPMKNPNCERAL
jgi:hypothetical protein